MIKAKISVLHLVSGRKFSKTTPYTIHFIDIEEHYIPTLSDRLKFKYLLRQGD